MINQEQNLSEAKTWESHRRDGGIDAKLRGGIISISTQAAHKRFVLDLGGRDVVKQYQIMIFYSLYKCGRILTKTKVILEELLKVKNRFGILEISEYIELGTSRWTGK